MALLFLEAVSVPKFKLKKKRKEIRVSSHKYHMSPSVFCPNQSHCPINNGVDPVYIPAFFKVSLYFVCLLSIA